MFDKMLKLEILTSYYSVLYKLQTTIWIRLEHFDTNTPGVKLNASLGNTLQTEIHYAGRQIHN